MFAHVRSRSSTQQLRTLLYPLFGDGALGEQWPAQFVASKLHRRTALLEVTRREVVHPIALYSVVTSLPAERHGRVDLIRHSINLVAVRRRQTNAHFEHFGQLLLLVLSTPRNQVSISLTTRQLFRCTVISHADGRVFTGVCMFVCFPYDFSKIDVIDVARSQPNMTNKCSTVWKPSYFEVKRSKVKVTTHESQMTLPARVFVLM